MLVLNPTNPIIIFEMPLYSGFLPDRVLKLENLIDSGQNTGLFTSLNSFLVILIAWKTN